MQTLPFFYEQMVNCKKRRGFLYKKGGFAKKTLRFMDFSQIYFPHLAIKYGRFDKNPTAISKKRNKQTAPSPLLPNGRMNFFLQGNVYKASRQCYNFPVILLIFYWFFAKEAALVQDVGIWSVIPPLVAIVLAILTKEVIFSLACGILSGTVIYVLCNQLSLVQCFSTAVDIMITKLGENIAMIVFLSL